jgi:hypothetical protein
MFPTKRTFVMICFYVSGWASLEEFAIESVPLALRQSPPRHIGSSNANGDYRAEH